MDKEMLNIGFGNYIHKQDILGIYTANTTIKKLVAPSKVPTPYYVANNLNGRKCQSYIETPFHMYLCAIPVDILLEEYRNEVTPEGEKIRDEIENGELGKAQAEASTNNYYSIRAKLIQEANDRALVEYAKLKAKQMEDKEG